MRTAVRALVWTSLVLTMAGLAGTRPVFGQGSATSSLSGTVVDSSSAVIPGATVGAKNKATNTDFNTVTSDPEPSWLPDHCSRTSI